MENERRLWAAVLGQAFEDLEFEEFQSYWWNQAAAFFFGGGEWIESRRTVCDFLGLDPSDLRRPALRLVNKRRLAAGLPPLQPRSVSPGPRPPEQRGSAPAPRKEPARPLPVLVATFNDPPERKRRGGHPSKRWSGYNPFDPFRPLPSDVRRADKVAANR